MTDAFGGLMNAAHWGYHFLEESRIAGLVMELKAASIAAEMGAVAAGAIPVVGMFGVFAALGSGYLGARDNVRKENMASGYSQGFVMGILDWEWHHAVSRFGRHGVLSINKFDEQTDQIRVKAYMESLLTGFKVGKKFDPVQKKAYLSGIKIHTNTHQGNWTRNDQVSYVIDLSAVYRRKFMRY